MKKQVMLSIRGRQAYLDQEPDVIELVTEGTLEYRDNGWDLCYEESDLTGLAGVTTTFRAKDGEVILKRTGNLHSEMIFKPGFVHDSLYRSEFGTLMLRVCATRISCNIGWDGGTVDLCYNIEIEHNAAGVIDYHLQIRPK